MSSGSQTGTCSLPPAPWLRHPWEQVWITPCRQRSGPRRCRAAEGLVQTCQLTVKPTPTVQVRPVFLHLAWSRVRDNKQTFRGECLTGLTGTPEPPSNVCDLGKDWLCVKLILLLFSSCRLDLCLTNRCREENKIPFRCSLKVMNPKCI